MEIKASTYYCDICNHIIDIKKLTNSEQKDTLIFKGKRMKLSIFDENTIYKRKHTLVLCYSCLREIKRKSNLFTGVNEKYEKEKNE